jgi:hypothetical protein
MTTISVPQGSGLPVATVITLALLEQPAAAFTISPDSSAKSPSLTTPQGGLQGDYSIAR